MPIICNVEGKKLSKRDFGFSLTDLKNAGFLPEAICNYLVTIGGSFDEIASLSELVQKIDLASIASTSHIRYDVEKLRWINHQWIMRLGLVDLAQRCLPFIVSKFPQVEHLNLDHLATLLGFVRSSIQTLADSSDVLAFYFHQPVVEQTVLEGYNFPAYNVVIKQLIQDDIAKNPSLFNQQISTLCKEHGLPAKNLFALIRTALTGSPQGPAIVDLVTMLGTNKVQERLQILLK